MRLASLMVGVVLLAQQPTAPPAQVAEAFFDLLPKQEFGAAVAMMNQNLAPKLPEPKLREVWTGLAFQGGAFKSREAGVATPAGNGHAVKIRAAFDRIQLDFTIGVVNGRISGLNIAPAVLSSAPPAYSMASAFAEREVTVGEGEWALPGTLSMPVGEGPFPAVVLVHGSGPNDRDETLGPNRPFRDLAHGLASRGIAVLRYDKRTKVHGAKMASIARPTVRHEAIDDAVLAVALAAGTPAIAPDRIFVVGHSLGGMLVPRIAAAAPSARGFVVLAGPARPLEQAIVEQLEYIARLDGAVTKDEQARIDNAQRDLRAVRALKPGDMNVKQPIAGVPRSYWLDIRGYDPPKAAQAVTRPMLILQGERDYQVTMKEFARWKQVLDGRANVTFKSYPALNHLFMPGTGPGSPMEYALPGHVDEDVVTDIAAWIARVGRPAPLDVAIVPKPVRLDARPGRFVLGATTPVVADAAFRAQARQLASMLAPATGFDLPVRAGASPGSPHIALRLDRALQRTLGAEGYTLDVSARAIVIRAAAPAGAFYGMQTLRQLLPADIYREGRVAREWSVPGVRIEDTPRFAWRGMHLDVARHFQPKEFVKKYIDLLALHKMNRFHWHLTDDQGWRVEIRKYPKLTEVGAWRKHTLIGPHRTNPQPEHFDNNRHGGFYTQDDIREIVAYAAERFVTIVPEIEMPGHAQAVIAAYPELGSTTEPVEVRTTWSVSQQILNVEPSTIAFMQDVLAEVLELFPGTWIHIGGDEADKTQWKANARIQARMKELDVKDEHELQSWFIRQMDAFLTARKRRLIGWDEILEGGLAENATVMAWRGVEHAVTAARSGHDAVMTPTSHTYFDYLQSQNRAAEPLAIGGFLPLEKVYAFDPMPSDLEPAFRKHILGAQGQLWSEYLPNPKAVEYMAFPRASALSEVVWSPPAGRSFDEFRARLAAHLERLRMLDVNFRGLD